MFEVTHIIWLLISLTLIGVLAFINKKKNLSFKTNIRMMTIISILSEVTKTLINIKINETGDAYYLLKGQLPLHLCSLQIFFIFYLDFICKDEKKKDVLLSFMFPTMLVGAIAAMMIPTEGTSFLNIQTYQYYIYHSFLVYFAIYLVSNKIIKITFKTILRNYGILIFIAFLMIDINSALQDHGANYLYLSRPPLDGLPILNLNHGWYAYFLTLIIIGVVVLALIQLPFAIKNKDR